MLPRQRYVKLNDRLRLAVIVRALRHALVFDLDGSRHGMLRSIPHNAFKRLSEIRIRRAVAERIRHFFCVIPAGVRSVSALFARRVA